MMHIDRYNSDDENADKCGVGRYKLKVYHMDDDEFRGKVYP